MGFLTQHVKMTNLFEAAVQAVDPSVSLPYWDFTIESESGTVVQKSTIFSKEMFGSIPVPVDNRWGFVYENDDIVSAAIPDGRWAYIKADLTPSKFSGTQLDAAYSYLRAPWNMNPSPYVSRFSSYSSALPGCDDYYRWAKNSDLTDFMSDSPYGPHAGRYTERWLRRILHAAVYLPTEMSNLRRKKFLICSTFTHLTLHRLHFQHRC